MVAERRGACWFRPVPAAAWLAACALLACEEPAGSDGDGDGDGDGDSDGDADSDVEPVVLDPTEHTYLLAESPPGVPIWTTPPARRLAPGARPPSASRSGLALAAARREHEIAQVAFGPARGDLAVRVEPFATLGSAPAISIEQATFRAGFVEGLAAVAPTDTIALAADRPVVVWITVRVPDDAPAGEHATTVVATVGGAEVRIPLALRVFDFAIPEEIHFATQINVDLAALVSGGTVDAAKDLLFALRLTPKNPAWPSGFGWGITWENERSSRPCEVLWDEPDEPPEHSVGHLARRYILGEGWNGVGFPTAMIFQFVDNDTPRPATFCGLERGDHRGAAGYNAEWSEYLSALDAYLVEAGLAERAYYYVQNEPQDADDEALAAHLCRLTRAAAPHLRIAISEEPKPSIAEDPGGACGYDIWIAHVRAYEQGYAWRRQREHGEEVWLYSLPQDPEPYFNPTRDDASGMDLRIIPWVSWLLRATGWAYYDGSIFFDGARANVRGALMREGLEDYEYLWLASGGARPVVGERGAVDAAVESVASGLTSWCRDPDALATLRRELGLYLEGSRDTVPVLETESGIRPRGEYFVNFQDPAGRPAAEPLVVGGREWIKVGWEPYDEARGVGWYGEHVSDPAIALYGFDEVDGYDDVERSYVYDDYGRDNLFELALENGRYEVTIGVGRPARGYPDDPHLALIEGTMVVDDEVTTDAEPQLRRSTVVDLTDGSLSVVVGGRSPTTGEYAYTFLAYLEVVPVE